jgi:Fic family protein
MLFTYRSLTADERRVIDRTSEMRSTLQRHVTFSPRRWTGLLARMTRARALRATNSIEGIHVSAEDALAVVDNEDTSEADKETQQAVRGYQTAMDYVLQRCRDSEFRFSLDVILAVHFMINQHDLSANPGQLRPGWVGVHNSLTGQVVHEGVDRPALEPLMRELVDYLNDDTVQSPMLRGAMAHLNIAMLHPFSDGNGRTARCIHTASLAHEGIVNPIFSSIEEYIGRNQHEYYNVLAATGKGAWNAQNDCQAWVRFCITAHYRQAQTLLKRTKEIESLYSELEAMVSDAGLHERTTLAVLQAAIIGRVRNSSYRVSADISNNLASRDLKDLVDAKLIEPVGEKRGRHYAPTARVQDARRRVKSPKMNDDPFADPDLIGPQQLQFPLN